MRHGSLFSGVGGFDLASQWMGWENVFQVEIDPFCQKVLLKNFPDVKKYKDIKNFDGTKYKNKIDIISGGFPCQPFSCAGKQRGKEDDRYLWPEMLRVISEVRPTWIVGENVAGIINMGLDQVLSDLESEDYEVQPFIIPACAVNAPHRRDRVWIVANSRCSNGKTCNSNGMGDGKRGHSSQASLSNNSGATSDSKHKRCVRRSGKGHTDDNRIQTNKQAGNQSRRTITRCNENGWQEPWLEVATRLCRVDDGLSRQMDRTNRLKALGNAIVPQIVYVLFKAIAEQWI